jgi:hypothetical protein
MDGELAGRVGVVLACVGTLALGACLPTDGSRERACDEPALERALGEFEADPGRARATPVLLDALASACPTLPPKVIEMMRDDYVGHDRRTIEWGVDPGYAAGWRATCADFPTWAATVAYLPGAERAQATFEICRLERFGLLAPAQRYVDDDRSAFIAHDWLVRHGVDSDLARRFAQRIMTATGPEPAVLRRCEALPNSDACVSLARLGGGAGLPSSSANLYGREGVLVAVSRNAIRMVDEPPLELDEGVVREADLQHHVIVPLRAALAKRAALEQADAVELGRSGAACCECSSIATCPSPR